MKKDLAVFRLLTGSLDGSLSDSRRGAAAAEEVSSAGPPPKTP